MEYIDEKILEAKRELERQKHTTLETGIYVEDELITFSQITLPDSSIHMFAPDSFIQMPQKVKDIKYPSKNAPDYILTSLDSTVNIGLSLLPVILQEGETKTMSSQFQNAITNVNPSIKIQNQMELETSKGNEMSWFEFKGYNLDGQSYNRMYIVRMRKNVLYGVFNCFYQFKNAWVKIVEQLFASIEEDV